MLEILEFYNFNINTQKKKIITLKLLNNVQPYMIDSVTVGQTPVIFNGAFGSNNEYAIPRATEIAPSLLTLCQLSHLHIFCIHSKIRICIVFPFV